jgi:two-component system phosphate regulon sensor histidine kinase PhoR
MLRCVQKTLLESFKSRYELLLRFFNRRRGLAMRIFLCWVIGCIALSNDELNSYDQRFQLRGDQKTSSSIALVNLNQNDFETSYGQRTNSIGNMSEVTDITDSFFWNKKIWVELLTRILIQKPKSVAVTFYFGDNIGNPRLTPEEQKIFLDQKVTWGSTLNSLERNLMPAFSNRDGSNVGSNEIRKDEDGIVRRVFPQKSQTPHLIERITGKDFPTQMAALPINFRGASKVFNQYSLSQILYDDLPPDTFYQKIVVIGVDASSAPSYMTPLGTLSRSEIFAHLTDTLIGNKWIKRFSFGWYASALFLLLLIAVFFITTYPQSVALFFILWTGTLLAALSAWVFDTFYLWTPAYSPFLLLTATWIIFIGYQATKIEKQNFRLQQEQQYLHELEQLKNNFVSLISHDLKTPIAKIQAIVDRLLVNQQQVEIHPDLRVLRLYSDELNKYIQSILKLLRVESRDFRLNIEVADINDVILEALNLLKPLAQEKNISVNTRLEPIFSLEFDTMLMKEVIINLIENAIKYTPTGGSIEIKSFEDTDNVNVCIKDTGDGIKPEDMDRVWGKFTRGSDQDLKTKGTGLGLYLVKYFIEMHGGKVKMESAVGKGTIVSFSLPLDSEVIA